MALFGDVYKPVKDFFGKTFSYDHKVELKATAPNGVVFTTEGALLNKGTAKVSLKGEYKKGDVQVNKVQISSDGVLEGEFSLPNVAAGTKAIFNFVDGTRASGANTAAKFAVESLQDLGVLAGFKAQVDAVQGLADASVLLNQGNVLLGASTAVNANVKDQSGVEVTSYDAVLAYKQGATLFGVQTGKKMSTATAFLHTIANPKVLVAGQASFGLNPSAGQPVSVAMGATYLWDEATKISGAVNDSGSVKLAYNVAVSPTAALNVYGEVKALDIASDSHRFGTKLSLRA